MYDIKGMKNEAGVAYEKKKKKKKKEKKTSQFITAHSRALSHRSLQGLVPRAMLS